MRHLLLAILLTAACSSPPSPQPTAGVVSADHPLASEAGGEALRAGGNAADAAVAAALAGGVVQPHSSGLGGGGFALVVTTGKDPVALDFREVAPAAAYADMYLDEQGRAQSELSLRGALAVAVPGEGRGLAELQRRWGRLDLAQVAAPAIRYAEEGFAVGGALATAARRWERAGEASIFGALFEGFDGPPAEGQQVRRPRLASALRAWVDSDGEAFHQGPLAQDLVQALRQAGGSISVQDLAEYRVRDRVPLRGSYRGHPVLAMPPPSSGGLVILQAMQVLQAWEPEGQLEPDALHRAVETLKHGFADRARWMGDPDVVQVPVDALLSAERVAEVRAAVDGTGLPGPAAVGEAAPCQTLESAAYGLPLDPGQDAGTHHISVLDGQGMAVALTTTINGSFGSGFVAPASGLLLNNQMDDFVAAPGTPNQYGLLGNARNAVGPGRRPLSSMSPTVVLDEQGRPLLLAGASGGPRIISATLQVLRAVLDEGISPQQAVAAPRYHHQWMPDRVLLDAGVPAAAEEALLSCGHEVLRKAPAAAVQVAARGTDGRLLGAGDPRKGGLPAFVEP